MAKQNKVTDLGKKSRETKLIEQTVSSVVLIIVGIMFCLGIGTNVVSIIMGVSLCLLGLVNLIILALNKLPLASMAGLFNAFILAMGVIFITHNLIAQFISWIPYILAVAGIVVAIDGLLAKFSRKDVTVIVFLLEIVIGVAISALGFCLIFIESMRKAASIIFGVAIIVSAVLSLINLILDTKK